MEICRTISSTHARVLWRRAGARRCTSHHVYCIYWSGLKIWFDLISSLAIKCAADNLKFANKQKQEQKILECRRGKRSLHSHQYSTVTQTEKHWQSLQFSQRRQEFPGIEGGGGTTTGRTNHSHAGFSIIHIAHIKLRSLRKFFDSR